MLLAGGWVRSRRDLQNMRGTELAEKAKIHRSILGRLERGSTPFTVPYVIQVADGLGVSREELVVRAIYDFARREPCQAVRGEGAPHLHSGHQVRAQPSQPQGHAPARAVYSPTRPLTRPPQIVPRSP
ncbi:MULTISPECIES: helix-turn-helix domain-containing protein [unclassified Amycolatopsis]|uniref:helix-turn-helix domain-containing protein n=1 Tax=unclassified Amycolatopsis TaxID=2618356 RepID=UPI0037BF1259